MASGKQKGREGAQKTAGEAQPLSSDIRLRLQNLWQAALSEAETAVSVVSRDLIRGLAAAAGLQILGVDVNALFGNVALFGPLFDGLAFRFFGQEITRLAAGKNKSEADFAAALEEALQSIQIDEKLVGLLTSAEFQQAMDWLEKQLEGLLTADDFEKGMASLLSEIRELDQKLEGVLTAEEFRQTMRELLDRLPQPEPAAALSPEEAQALLDQMPTGRVPPIDDLPAGSRLKQLQPNPHFVGRDAELMALAAALKDHRGAVVSTGVGGMGKTQLAIEFAHRYGRYFTGGVFWLTFSQEERRDHDVSAESAIDAEIANCGGRDGLALDGFDALDQPEQVKAVQRAWRQPTPRLLIFDNCEDEVLVARARPETGGGRVLVTSRSGRWSPTAGLRSIPLKSLPRPASIKLLRALAGIDGAPDATLGQIAHELGDLPLALHLAGRYLRESGDSAADYLAALQADNMTALGQQYNWLTGLSKGDTPTKHDLDVARTFRRSYERLESGDVDTVARRLLAMAACFAPGEPIPWDLLLLSLGATADDDGQRHAFAARNRLVELGLAEGEPDQAIRLHRLVAAFARSLPDEPEAQGAVEQAIFREAGRLNRAGYPAALRGWQIHFQMVTELALAHEDELATSLANQFGYYLKAVGNLTEAEPYYERALALIELQLASDPAETATLLNNLGELKRAKGDLAGARPLLVRALAIREKVLGPFHPETAISLSNLGALSRRMGDFIGARKYLDRALTVTERTQGLCHYDTAIRLNNLGMLQKAMNDLVGARSYFEKAQAILEKVRGPDHPDTAISLMNLGTLLVQLGDMDGARLRLDRALRIFERELGSDHSTTAICLNEIGRLLQAKGELAGARSHYQRALAILDRALGPNHRETRTVRANLAALG